MATSNSDPIDTRIHRRPVPMNNYRHQADVYDMYLDSPAYPSSSPPPYSLLSPSSQSSSSLVEPPPQPPRPRPSRSATNLHAVAHHPEVRTDSLPIRSINAQSTFPVGFITDSVPPSQAASLAPEPDQAIRRVKSSSALSALSASDAVSHLPTEPASETPSKWKAALGSAQYFAGGLISHPAESSRHFSIIRHSPALIWYRGPSTSISISILSDEVLVDTRTLWMQQKGFTGGMGMTIKALTGTTTSWINVTAERRATVENISEADERGIQRDLKRFAKKASGKQKQHIPRETHVVRIPASAADGYFRLVLCAGSEPGKKVLCGSPVFRVASTSTDVSVLRGASLTTMPLEVGARVASTIGQTWVKKYTGVAGAVMHSRGSKVVTSSTAKKVGKMAYRGYQTSGMADVVQESWRRQINNTGRYDPFMLDAPVGTIGSDAGPEAPFPVKLEGTVVKGTGKSASELGMPTANLSGISESIKTRMGGTFAAWARIQPPKASKDEDISLDWLEAVVTIAPLRFGAPSVAVKNTVTVHIIYDFEDTNLLDAKIKVILMGYLHPAIGPSTEKEYLMEEHTQDVVTTLASLGREAWQPQLMVDKLKGVKRNGGLGSRLDEATGKLVQQVDRIPVHWAGVRSESSAMQDRVYGIGGIWIPR